MKKTIQKGILVMAGLCVLIALFNFIAPLPANAQSTGDGCFGYSVPDQGPLGWKCICGQFVDCWRRYDKN